MDTVYVIMSTYNGTLYLREQLDSIRNQTGVTIKLFVRDDGSTDDGATLSLLKAYSEEHTEFDMTINKGSNLGPGKSFFELVRLAPEADYYAFSDQDDIWKEDKMLSAVKALKKEKGPSLYYSQTSLVDSNLNPLETKKLNPEHSVAESLFVNYATGCTFVFNKEMRKMVLNYIPRIEVIHDYWIYRLALYTNSVIIFDAESHILYRQHGNNVIGLKKSFWTTQKRRFKRIIHKKRERSSVAEEMVSKLSECVDNHKDFDLVKKAAKYRTSFKDKFLFLTDKRLKPKFNNFKNVVSILTSSY